MGKVHSFQKKTNFLPEFDLLTPPRHQNISGEDQKWVGRLGGRNKHEFSSCQTLGQAKRQVGTGEKTTQKVILSPKWHNTCPQHHNITYLSPPTTHTLAFTL
jgi:hypothetical protein